VDPELGITTSVSPEVLREYLDKNDVDAVFLTNPNYYGVSGNIRELVDIVHEHGLPIVVDEAHGAHFHFHQALPLSAVDAGAESSGAIHSQNTLLHDTELLDAYEWRSCGC